MKDIADLLVAYFPEYGPLVVAILIAIYFVNQLRSAFQGLPTTLGSRLGGSKRAKQKEDLLLIQEQLRSDTLLPELREMLEMRAAELLVSLNYGVELPWNQLQQVIKISTNKNPDGLTWNTIRRIQERMEFNNGRVTLHVSGRETVWGSLQIGIGILLYLGAFVIFYSMFQSLDERIYTELLNSLGLAIIGLIIGYGYLRDGLKTRLLLNASRKLNALEYEHKMKVEAKNLGTTTPSLLTTPPLSKDESPG